MKHNEEKEIGKFYKGYLERELRDPEIARAKKQLIETYFPREPFVFPLGWAVPAAGFIALCLLVYPVYLSVQQSWSKTQAGPVVSVPASVTGAAEVAASAVAGAEVKNVSAAPEKPAEALPPVMIKSVGSETGQVMIYKQNSRQENPVTIIWVFSGGK